MLSRVLSDWRKWVLLHRADYRKRIGIFPCCLSVCRLTSAVISDHTYAPVILDEVAQDQLEGTIYNIMVQASQSWQTTPFDKIYTPASRSRHILLGVKGHISDLCDTTGHSDHNQSNDPKTLDSSIHIAEPLTPPQLDKKSTIYITCPHPTPDQFKFDALLFDGTRKTKFIPIPPKMICTSRSID